MAGPEIEIYTWTFCPYCIRARQLLDSKGVSYTEHRIDGDEEARGVMMHRSGGRRSVPQVFVGGRHIGGCSDLYALDAAGELDAILAGQA